VFNCHIDLFADGNDFSWETIQKGRIIYYQKKLADEITSKMLKMISLLTSTLNIHINVGQNYTMNTSEIFLSMETMTVNSLSNKLLKQVGNAHIHIPSNFNSSCNRTQTVSLRV
jgi:exosome complex RNA-binding protein Rrp4